MSKKDEMPLKVLLEIEVFNVWGIDFMGPFVSSCNNQYILLEVDYVSKWVEVKALPTNDVKVVLNFLHKQIFTRFGTPRVLISDEGSHFCNRKFTAMMKGYNVNHHIATAYHPQTNGQAEVSNREIKQILEKVAYWALKKLNLDLDAVGKKRMLQLNELDEFQIQAYENNKMYKDKVKRWHDRGLVIKKFVPAQQFLLFNSRFHLFPGKLKSRWSGPFIIKTVFPHGVVEIFENDPGQAFKVNGQRLNHYNVYMANREVVSLQKPGTPMRRAVPARGRAMPRFSTPEAEEEYTRLLAKPIAKERGFLPYGTGGNLLKMILEMGWVLFCEVPAAVPMSVVREFYANAKAEKNGFTVVRGRTVEYSAEAIRTVIEQPARKVGHDTWNDKTPEDFDLDLIVATLCRPDTHWKIKRGDSEVLKGEHYGVYSEWDGGKPDLRGLGYSFDHLPSGRPAAGQASRTEWRSQLGDEGGPSQQQQEEEGTYMGVGLSSIQYRRLARRMDVMHDIHSRFAQDLTHALGTAFRSTEVEIQWPEFGEGSVYPHPDTPDTPPLEGEDSNSQLCSDVVFSDDESYWIDLHTGDTCISPSLIGC
ncbi:hypothetical protein AgCh_038304 [Apium graveolens]